MKTIRREKVTSIVTCLAILTVTLASKPAHAERSKIHEIGWSSRLSSMGLNELKNVGQKYEFYCQPAAEDLIHAPIWGTYTYTHNSGICSTAVHAGMIEAKTGGEVTIKLLEGQTFYTGSNKNEITSQDHRGTKMSFTFVGEKMSDEQKQEAESSETRRSSGIKKVMVNGVERGIERSIEKVITEIFK